MTKRKSLQVDPAQAAFAREAKTFAVMRAANAKADASYTALNKAPKNPAAAYKAYMALYADAKAAHADWEAACRAADVYKKEATPADMAKSFNYYREKIQGIVHQFTHRPDDRDLAGHFNIWHSTVESCCRITGECIRNCPALPKLPGLIGNDYYAGMIHLEDFCKEAAKRLCAADIKAPAPVPTTVDRAAAYITKHPGHKTVIVCKQACDGMELASFISHVSPALRKRGFRVTRGCTAAWYPPEKAAE